MADQRPSAITGGCLCGAVRYAISFKNEGTWPPMVATCQCSMCRKWTGALLSTDLVIKKAQLSPDLDTVDTFTRYKSSPGNTRAFCSKCGSSIAWYSQDMSDDLIILVGTVDEEYVIGKALENTRKESEYGSEFETTAAYGKTLADSSTAGNLYWQNVIPGFTDNVPGPKFLQHYIGKAPLPDTTS